MRDWVKRKKDEEIGGGREVRCGVVCFFFKQKTAYEIGL